MFFVLWVSQSEGFESKKPPGFAAAAVCEQGLGACALSSLIRPGQRNKTKNKKRVLSTWANNVAQSGELGAFMHHKALFFGFQSFSDGCQIYVD
ncbi:MAG: hypothetical protein PHX60_13035 [Giesbergeria sp.]|uniref:hypothetical protein n=1 Tax=Giesbergeria sp. TaxID=2818473 RepID=UPI00261B6FA6|nr:hypothetical protein [Giesbergeria sp.]MDD2610586.1 hypothetical protein [Giesbergeria sp.]